jgi:Flp pilus assembly protein TadG
MNAIAVWIKNAVDDIRGVSAIEFALAAPMLVIATIALADFGLAVNEKMRLVSAARAGTQAGLSNAGSVSAMQTAVLAATGLNPSAVTVNATTYCGCADGSTVSCSSTCKDGSTLRSYVAVSVTETYSLLLNYPGFANPLTLSASSSLRTG